VAVIPLWGQGENQGVLVTTALKAQEALQATLMVQKLLQHYLSRGAGRGNNTSKNAWRLSKGSVPEKPPDCQAGFLRKTPDLNPLRWVDEEMFHALLKL